MSWLEIFLVWFAGLVNGFVFTSMLVLHIGKRALTRKPDTASPPKPAITDADIRARIRKVKDLTDMQMALQIQTDGPQRNAMDGKFKNTIIKDIKDLEEQKVEILKSIITDGFDPVISVANPDGTVETITLSQFMANKNITMPAAKDANDKVSERKKNLSKFTVYTGGKPDGGSTTH